MATKTINLTGAEVAVTGLDGAHAHIRNDGTEVIYAAKTAGITAGADGVASIPAGQSDTIRGISGAVYLLGSGSALVQSDDYVVNPFKSTVTLGSVTEEITRAVSNPNLLINPDFKINQRGSTIGTNTKITPEYCVDRWKYYGTFEVTDDGIIFSADGSAYGYGLFSQITDISSASVNEITLSAWVDGMKISASGLSTEGLRLNFDSGYVRVRDENNILVAEGIVYADNAMNLNKIKLESGSVATLFTPPDPANELMKCQRYYQIRSTGGIPAVDLRPSMRETPTVTQLSDGNYAYSAEL